MKKKIRILIADDIEETRKLIIRLLGMADNFDVVAEAANGKEVLDYDNLNEVDMVLMDINMPVMNGLEATKQLMLTNPHLIVVIMSVQSENEYLKKAMLCGAKEYIIKPFNLETLTSTLESTYDEYYQRNEKLKEAMVVSQRKQVKVASVHCIFSGKGSVGKTFVAGQLAWNLSALEHKKVLIIDGDFQFGDLGLSLGLKLSPNIGELSEDRHKVSYEHLKAYLQSPFNNCDVLLAPLRPEAAEGIKKEFIEEVVREVINEYDVILVDLGVNYSEETLTFLDLAQKVHIVTTPTVSSLHHTKVALEVMRSLSYDKVKCPILLNSYHNKCGFSLKEIESILGVEVKNIFPYEDTIVTDTLNRGDIKLYHKGFNKPKLFKQIGDYAKGLL